MKKICIVTLLALFVTCSTDNLQGIRNNPYDANGTDFRYNLAPTGLIIPANTWHTFYYDDSTGSIDFKYRGVDPNEDGDSLTYTVYLGNSSTALDSVYQGKDSVFVISNMKKGTRKYFRIHLRDRFDSTYDSSGYITATTQLPLPAPTSFSASAGYYSVGIALSWISNYNATGYRIYRSDSTGRNFTFLHNIPETNSGSSYYPSQKSWLDPISDYADHYYVISCYNKNGEGVGKDTLLGRNSSSTISAPSIYASDGSYADFVNLTWSDNSYSYSGFYKVYRASQSSGAFRCIATITRSGTYSYSYNDSVVSGQTYSYTLVLCNSTGTGSPFSYSNTGYIGTPSSPSITSISQGTYSGYIQISWYSVSNAAGYYIYRSASSYGPFTKIDSTTATTYNDTVPSMSNYYYTLTSYSTKKRESIVSSYSSVYGYKKPLAVPSSLTATNNLLHTVNLQWSNVTGASNYIIYRSRNDYLYLPIDTVATTAFTDSISPPDTLFYYKVSAFNISQGESQKSSLAIGSVLSPPYPYTINGSGRILTISFSTYIPAGLTANLYRAPHPDSSFVKIRSYLQPLTSTSSIYDTVPGCLLTYYYKLTSQNSSGESRPTAIYTAPFTLTTPSGLTATELPGAVRISWKRDMCAEQYIISRTSLLNALDTTVDTFFTEQLSTDSRYYYTVRSMSGSTISASSLSLYTGRMLLPGSPYNLGANSQPAYIQLSWTPATSGYSAATGYIIYRSTSSSGTFSIIDTSYTTIYNDSPALSPTTYYYRIAAYNAVGIGTQVGTTSGKLTPLLAPANVVATDGTDSTKIRITWKRSVGALKYYVYRAPNTSYPNTTLLDSTIDTSYNDSQALLSIRYNYQVSAYNPNGESPKSSLSNGVKFSPPLDVAATGTLSAIVINFTPVTSDNQFVLYRSTDSTSGFIRLDTIPRALYNDTVLISSLYYYYMTTLSSTGKESPKSPTTVGTHRLVPSAPDSVGASRGTLIDTIKVGWRASNGADGYQIYRSTDSIMAVLSLRGSCSRTTLTFNDTVTTDSLYYYSVKAYSGGGESVLSRVRGSGFRKSTQVPGIPTNVTATKNNASFVNITWQPPASGNQPTSYQIFRATSQNGSYAAIGTTTGRLFQDPVSATFPTSYWYKVAGVNYIGVGTLSPAVEGYRN